MSKALTTQLPMKKKRKQAAAFVVNVTDNIQCWRYRGIPLLPTNNITRSISEEFIRLKKNKVIFVEGGAIDVARMMLHLITNGFSASQESSDYITHQKCLHTDKFKISTSPGKDKIIFNGTSLVNEVGIHLCHNCFEFGMIFLILNRN